MLYQIEVTEDIASKIRLLAESGFFLMKAGSSEVHFDSIGNISQVILHTYFKPAKQPVDNPVHKEIMNV